MCSGAMLAEWDVMPYAKSIATTSGAYCYDVDIPEEDEHTINAIMSQVCSQYGCSVGGILTF